MSANETDIKIIEDRVARNGLQNTGSEALLILFRAYNGLDSPLAAAYVREIRSVLNLRGIDP